MKIKLIDLLLIEHPESSVDDFLFLRHSDSMVAKLRRFGATIEEYTAIQPINSRYDYLQDGKPRARFVVAIVKDRVHAVYEISKVEVVGLSHAICSPEYLEFEKARGKIPRQCRRFSLRKLSSGSNGASVTGWHGSRVRTPVQRHRDGFFNAIEVDAKPMLMGSDALPTDPEWAEGTPALRTHLVRERASGLAAEKKKKFIDTHGRLFCERCTKEPRKEYQSEFAEACIEVHHKATHVADMRPGHKTRLSDLLCLCANCHRITHREMQSER